MGSCLTGVEQPAMEVAAVPAVVVSTDPRRVYVKNPEEMPFKTVKVSSKVVSHIRVSENMAYRNIVISVSESPCNID
ncbi:hypothetical protein E2562_031324 [Oryza meyeriana var. granulata]|uniref:Uncharacterized protein n=1 Tax=Oryza meyeriana var. granulata TaxID=110450 RepID=A0A6G1CB45_9ORYZ|nr:hypothetical protein E2562_031324 [Oryza meyeriana var. granulata]